WGEREISLTPPWPRISLRQAIIEATGIDYLEITEQRELYERARAIGAKIEAGTVWPRIVDELLKTFVQPNLIQPTLLVDYPVQLSPLAKQSPENPAVAERFQAYIAGMEMGNAFSELNNPMEQLNRFLIQAGDRAAGDEEAMVIDEDFIRALMHGMPPTGGLGVGVDRLTMLLTNQQNIREVILFPHLRSKMDAESWLLGAEQPGMVAKHDPV
ncbi:MAG TPA: amino acid--tRNA ligase-related protein, partial [Nitrolancea sp.]|nr:amino acid--tRNA ligase-related protein [Nitrolancea sp.]